MFPESIGKLANLTKLDLAGNNLTVLPDSIGNLTNLTCLHLNNNKLTVLPESIGNLANLTELDLAGNNLTVLPDSIGNLANLTVLRLGRNELTVLPESIGNLRNLEVLNLNKNKLTVLPESIGKLTNLTYLDLKNNAELSELLKSIGKFANLTSLDIDFDPYKIRNEHQVVGIIDSPKYFPDRLEYRIYAEALVALVLQILGPNASFCVSLDAPWGAGKTFLYKLIKALLQNEFESEEEDAQNKREEDEKNEYKISDRNVECDSIVKFMRTKITGERDKVRKLLLLGEDGGRKRIATTFFLIMIAFVEASITLVVCTFILCIMGCLVLVKRIASLLVRVPSFQSFSTIVDFLRGRINHDENDENDETIQIAAILILGALVWIPLWIVFFILSCCDIFLSYIFCECKLLLILFKYYFYCEID